MGDFAHKIRGGRKAAAGEERQRLEMDAESAEGQENGLRQRGEEAERQSLPKAPRCRWSFPGLPDRIGAGKIPGYAQSFQ